MITKYYNLCIGYKYVTVNDILLAAIVYTAAATLIMGDKDFNNTPTQDHNSKCYKLSENASLSQSFSL